MKVEICVIVKNKLGLHLRPASHIVKIMKRSLSIANLIYNKKSVNARSMVSIAGLGVPEKAEVKFVVEGEDANEVAIALANAFAAKFGEEG